MTADGHGNEALDKHFRKTGGSRGKKLIHSDITSGIIRASFAVHNALGCGLAEKIYENALAWELTLDGRKAEQQREFPVVFREKVVGTYVADVLVEQKVLVEIKAADEVLDVHRAQLLNYMRIAGIRVGLLVNFGKPKLEFERMILQEPHPVFICDFSVFIRDLN